MIKTIEVVGQSGTKHICVPPTLWPGRELARPYADYFPGGDIDEWFEHSESWQKKQIGAMWGQECVVTGRTPADTHEIINQGMGERVMTLVPWNMIRLNHAAHVKLIHSYTWRIVHWDPLAWPKSEAVIILDRSGLVVRCWYNLPEVARERSRGYR